MEIQKFGEPRGALTGRSPKLVVFTYSGQFATLLLTVVGVQRRFEHSGKHGSANGEVTKTHSFFPFWPVLYSFNHSFGGSTMIPMLGESRGALTGRSPKHAVLAYS